MLDFETPFGPEPRGPGPGAHPLHTGGLPEAGLASGLLHCLVQSLDHVGRGMLLVGPWGHLLYANRQARAALASSNHALWAEQGQVKARHARDQKLLAEALQAALQKGVRRLLTLGRHATEAGAAGSGDPQAHADTVTSALTVALLPIEGPFQAHPAAGLGAPAGSPAGLPALRAQAVLISLQQCSHIKNLAVPIFAREHGCTDAETAVLEALLAGQTPEAIAQERGTRLCTVRTQIAQLRLKTGSHTIRELLDRVAALPPMMVMVQ